jgi:uncharacterized membrane protein YbhN (UPF0104 family)
METGELGMSLMLLMRKTILNVPTSVPPTSVSVDSYVIGFVVFIAPGGLGVREFMLAFLLTPELVVVQGMDQDEARATVVLAALVLRLVWTASELFVAALVSRWRLRAGSVGEDVPCTHADKRS